MLINILMLILLMLILMMLMSDDADAADWQLAIEGSPQVQALR